MKSRHTYQRRRPLIWGNLFNPMEKKTGFLPSCSNVSITLWMHLMEVNETEKNRWKLRKNGTSNFEEILKAIHNKRADIRPLRSHLTKHPSKMNKTLWVRLKKYRESHVTHFYGLLHLGATTQNLYRLSANNNFWRIHQEERERERIRVNSMTWWRWGWWSMPLYYFLFLPSLMSAKSVK